MPASCLSDDQLDQCLRGDPSAVDLQTWFDHLDDCASCRERFRSRCEDTTRSRPATSGIAETIDREVLERVRQRIPSAAQTAASDGRVRLPEIPGLIFESLLGEGGQAAVYRARQPHVADRTVAVKLLSLGTRPVLRAQWLRFQNEVTAYARLEHPSIVRMYDFAESGGTQYLVMEFVSGGTLRERIDRQRYSQREAAELVAILAEAIDYAHRQGIIHRDLKPRNILLGPNGSPKIGDFGLASLADNQYDLTHSRYPLGTKEYMSPEQAAGQLDQIGPGTDVYSLGVIMYELLAGRPPFVGDDLTAVIAQIRSDEPVALRSLRPGLSRDLENICFKCLEKRPAQRYPSARDLFDDLQRYLAGEPVLARPISVVERTRRWVRKRPAVSALSGAAIVLALALVATGFAFLVQNTRQMAAIRQERDRKEGYLNVARRTADRYLAELREDPRLVAQGLDPLHRSLVEDARELYERLANDRGTDSANVLARAEANLALGIIAAEFGDYAAAPRLIDLALAELTADDPVAGQSTVDAGRRLALRGAALRNKGYYLTLLGETQAARDSQQQAVACFSRLREADASDVRSALELAITQTFLGEAELESKRWREAQLAFEASAQLFEGLVQSKSAEGFDKGLFGKMQFYQGMNDYNLAISLMVQDQMAPAEAPFRSAIERFSSLVQANPEIPKYQSRLARSHLNYTIWLSQANQLGRAADEAVAATNIGRGLVRGYPHVQEYQTDLIAMLGAGANLDLSRGKWADAEAKLGEGDALVKNLDRTRLLPRDNSDLGSFYAIRGLVASQTRQPEAARMAYDRAIEFYDLAVRKNPRDFAAWRSLGVSFGERAKLAADPADREADHRSAIANLTQAATLRPGDRLLLDVLFKSTYEFADLLAKQARILDAAEVYLACARLLEAGGEKWLAQKNVCLINAGGYLCNHGNIVRKEGQVSGAIGFFEQARQVLLASRGGQIGEDNRQNSLRITLTSLASAQESLRQFDVAAQCWRDAAESEANAEGKSLFAMRAAGAQLCTPGYAKAFATLEPLADAEPDYLLLQYSALAALVIALDPDQNPVANQFDATTHGQMLLCAIRIFNRLQSASIWDDLFVQKDLHERRVRQSALKIEPLRAFFMDLADVEPAGTRSSGDGRAENGPAP